MAVLVLGTLGTSRFAQAGDPRLRWYTLEAGRFRVHYHGGLEATAQRAARLATQIEDELVKLVGARPTERTEILLEDAYDDANGSAMALPYSKVYLRVTAPDDMDTLGVHDDWLSTLMMHEDTHIVHMNSVSGLPALVNAIIGKTAVPNQLQPRWMIEGLAVYAETRLSGGGRLRSSAFEMMLRADVIERQFATLDQITGEPLRWPSGIYYLYGAKFLEFIAGLYGPSVFAAAAQDSGDDVLPFAVSRPFYRATGRTIEQLYFAFRQSAERRVAEQLAAVRARGIRQGRPLTAHGRTVSNPRIVPDRCRRSERNLPVGSHAASSDPKALVYYRDDGHQRAGYYELVWDPRPEGAQVSETLITRASGANASLGPDCSLWFESQAWSTRRYLLTDLFRQLPGTTSPSGVDPSRQRMTVGRRALDPDVSPDGRHLVYVTNRAGTTTLRIATIDASGTLGEERMLVPSAQYEQVFTPRFSPDGTRVAYSVWTRGGMRDLRIVEVATGNVVQPWKDRSIDQQPVFSPDGKRLYFSSDRSGISNIYVYDLSQKKLSQVTNVETGAFMPEVSADEKQLFYVGYGSRGYDLYAMPIDERQFLEVNQEPTAPDDRVILDDRGAFPAHPYSAWSTMRPRALAIDYSSDASGQRLVLSTTGSDIVQLHSINATAVFEPEGGSPDLYLKYRYSRLPSEFFATGYRISDPNISYSYGSYGSRIEEVRTGAAVGITLPSYREFEAQAVSLVYLTENVSSVLPTGLAADPYATVPREPRRGISSRLQLYYDFSNTEGSHYAVGAERGITFGLHVEEAHRGLGSELEGTKMTGQFTGYVLLPWLRHHVLAMSARVGASTGDGVTGFSLGGYQDSALLTDIIRGPAQHRISLRGYPSGRFGGRRLLLTQAEYRLPLLYLDRGYTTLPFFLRKLGAAFSSDAGSAFNEFDPHAFDRTLHWSFAGELWFDFVLSYRIPTQLVLGYATGSGVGAIDGGTGYLVMGSAL